MEAKIADKPSTDSSRTIFSKVTVNEANDLKGSENVYNLQNEEVRGEILRMPWALNSTRSEYPLHLKIRSLKQEIHQRNENSKVSLIQSVYAQ